MTSPVDEISQVIKQFTVVLGNKVLPVKGTVLVLRTYVQQVEPVNVWRDVGVLGLVTKDTHTTTLGKLAVLIIQIFYNNMYTWSHNTVINLMDNTYPGEFASNKNILMQHRNIHGYHFVFTT